MKLILGGISFAVLGSFLTVLVVLFLKLLFLLLPFILLYYLLVILPRRSQNSQRAYSPREYRSYEREYRRYEYRGDDLDLSIPPDRPLPGPWSQPQQWLQAEKKETEYEEITLRGTKEKGERKRPEEVQEICPVEDSNGVLPRDILPPERCQAPAAGYHWLWQRQGFLAGLIWAEILPRRSGWRYGSCIRRW